VFEPRIDGSQRLGIKVVEAMAALAALHNEMSAAQDGEMTGNGRAGDGEGFGDAAGRLTAAAEEVENRTAGGVGEGGKGSRGGTRNRCVTHHA